MIKKYRHLSQAERIQIEKYLALEYSLSKISILLKRHKSTISREVSRYRKKQYNSYDAHQKYFIRLMNKNYGRSKILSHPPLLKFIHRKIKKRWSPEQISLTLKKNLPNELRMNVSHETIYFYIYLHSKKNLKEVLIKHLRQKRKTQGLVRTKAVRDVKISERITIDERPEEVIGR